MVLGALECVGELREGRIPVDRTGDLDVHLTAGRQDPMHLSERPAPIAQQLETVPATTLANEPSSKGSSISSGGSCGTWSVDRPTRIVVTTPLRVGSNARSSSRCSIVRVMRRSPRSPGRPPCGRAARDPLGDEGVVPSDARQYRRGRRVLEREPDEEQTRLRGHDAAVVPGHPVSVEDRQIDP